jgi:perosamine synthetase
MIKKKFIPVNIPIITNKDALEVYKVVKSGWVSSSGLKINKFEKKLAQFTNRKFASCVSNGTAALEIAVKSLGINKNDEVIVPTFTIISNANAVLKNFAKVVLIDSDPITWNININDIKNKITSKTKAIMLPHIYGFPNDMKKIINICKKNKLYLIEDAAEMIGQKFNNIPCGSFGDISTFSFYANKHITTGEGGAVLTNNKKLNKKINELRNLSFGKKNRFNHTDLSWNYRFTNIQAALGLSQLKRIKSIVKRKREIGMFYYNNFKQNQNLQIQPYKLDYASNIYWVFGIVLKNKFKNKSQEIQKKLLRKNIETRSFFWPIHKQTIFKKMGLFKKESYPVAENLSKNGFYLPSGLGLSNKQLEYIVKITNKVLN